MSEEQQEVPPATPGHWLRLMLDARGFTITDLAKRSGVHRGRCYSVISRTHPGLLRVDEALKFEVALEDPGLAQFLLDCETRHRLHLARQKMGIK